VPSAAKHHLIRKLRDRLKEVTFKFMPQSAMPGILGEAAEDDNEIWLVRDCRPEELVHTVIHELLHVMGYNEEATDEALDRICYASPSLRADVAMKLLETRLLGG